MAGLGQIVTFYSYKGGTGRTMALANVAWILASNGRRVLAVDWDLEAPGLHRFFAPFLLDKNLEASDGVIDFATDFAVAATTPSGPKDDEWLYNHANLLNYAVSLDWSFPGMGTLDFMPAGRQSQGYSARVNSFNWSSFYRLGGDRMLEAVRQHMRNQYDYTLIDSRTGISDTSGICTVQLPDVLVACFTLNRQSIDGMEAVLDSVRRQRGSEPRILPVTTRIEFSEKVRLDEYRAKARQRFGRYLDPRIFDRERYWAAVEVPYIPYYAYGEALATFAEVPGSISGILGASERLADYITEGYSNHASVVEEHTRLSVLKQYEEGLL